MTVLSVRRSVTSRAAPAAAPPTPPPRTRPLAALLLTALLGTACAAPGDGTPDDDRPPADTGTATPHGYVEGAQEAAEQQSRLLLNDPGSGATQVLDLITGEVHDTAPVRDAVRIGTDGRFGFLHTSRAIGVLDGGTWMVDHGDHVHYYRAAVRDVGELPAGDTAQVRSDAAVTVMTDGGGRAALYQRTELEKGRIGEPSTLPGTYTGAVVPYAGQLVALEAGAGGGAARLVVLDRAGRKADAPDAVCAEPRGDAVTRRGVVLGCADGALLIAERDGALTVEKIPYDRKVPEGERAGAFRHRPGSDTLTAPAGDDAVWVLDVGEGTWTRVETGPVLAANTAGEGSPLLVLRTDGTLRALDIAQGTEVARTERLVTPGDGAAPVIEVDRSRAYVNDPHGRRVLEIDYADGLRIARTFALDLAPRLMAETGR
ncbi:hypothetical protein AB0D49_23095 [Streptomyces sp. NPDC048290]|uniref:hypothetical protein n=1 Tax=Streptomyces sp. NPDC048290 TaxID=3155811 RepID=UPI0034274383